MVVREWVTLRGEVDRFHVRTLVIYKLGFDQNYYTFTLVLLIKIVMRSTFS